MKYKERFHYFFVYTGYQSDLVERMEVLRLYGVRRVWSEERRVTLNIMR